MDYDTVTANPGFQKLMPQGITLTRSHGCAHPSEENYLCSTTGETWGLNSDDEYHLPDKYVLFGGLVFLHNLTHGCKA